MTHAWHDVPTGEKAPHLVNSIIEIPKGFRAKYELDKETGLLRLNRVLFSSVYYPANYGFIPQTLGEDEDPLDILVLSQIDLEPLCLVEAKVLGVMQMLDSGKADDKIIAVAAHDISVNYLDDIGQLPLHFLVELRNFFENYKKLENKTVRVEEFQPREIAYQTIWQSRQYYQTMIGSKSPESSQTVWR